MPKFDFYPSFNAGEVSPLIDARTSLEKYRSACRTLENFQILPYGGVIRRPGTQYLGNVKNSANQTRLIGFNFSTTTRFVIEMGVGYMRFWRPDGTLQTNSGGLATLEVTTPYTAADLREIQYVQINDIMYFAHANYPVYKLSRLADNSWTFAVVNWSIPPQLDQNEEEVTISTNYEIGNVNLTASAPIFKSGHVGTKWNLKWKRLATFIELNFGGTWASNSMDTQGAWDFTTFGTWNATIRILRTPYETWKKGFISVAVARSGTTCTVTHPSHGYSVGDLVHFVTGPAPFYKAVPYTILSTGFTANSYQVTVANSGATSATVVVENISQMEIVKEYDSNSDRNVIASGNEAQRCGLKMHITAYTAPSVAPTLTPRALLQNGNNYTGGTVKINSVAANGLTASATVIEWLGAESRNSKPTTVWTEPAFSGERGYPRTVALHEQRLMFGGTTYQPNTIWGSVIDDFENFQTGATASDAVNFTLSASEGNRINWMYSQSRLLIGTSGDEWTIGSADSTQSLSATNVQAQRQSSYGSKYLRGALVNDVLLFVQRNGRKVRELVYDLNKDGWVAPDLTLLAEHITNGEIVEIAYQQQPDAVLWCVRGDGSLIAMTYERDQKVVGWHRHNFGDADVESVATIYGNGTEDELWMCVKRYQGIVAGMRVQFTNLPAGSGLSASETYIVSQNLTGNSFYIRNRNYENLALSNSAITPNTTQVTVVGGNFSTPITSLVDGALTYSGVAPGTTRTVERFPLLWRNYFDEENANEYRYLDCNTAIMTGVGPFTTTVSGLSHLNGKTVTVVQGSNVVNRIVNNGSITAPSTNSGYLGLPYTSTLTPMKLDAEFEDGTAQGRKKRIHQIVVRTLKSRGGQVRTNNGDWYNLASTTTSGDQKMILAGAFGLDADVSLRQTDPYPMCVLAITPKWDAYGNE
jgi:hypothetical protein